MTRSPMPPTEPTDARPALDDLVASAGDLAELPPAEAVRVLDQVLGRADAQADALAKTIPAPASAGWFGAVCPLLFGIRLLRDSLDDVARRGAPTLRVYGEQLDDESRSVARVFPTRAWHRAMLPTTTGDIWLAPSATEEQVLEAQTEQTRSGWGDSRIELVDAGSSFEGLLNALHHVFVGRQPVLLVSKDVDAETERIRLLDELLEPLSQRGWLSRMSDVDLVFDAETMHGPRRDAGGLTPLVVIPYLFERKELVAVARWVASQHRSPMPWLGRRVLVLPAGWRQREPFIALLEQILGRGTSGEDVLRDVPSLLTEHDDGMRDGRLDVLTVGSEDVGTFLDAASAELTPSQPVCTAFAVDPAVEEDPALGARFREALQRWPSRVLVINHSPEVAYSLTLLPWPTSDASGRAAVAHNGAMIAEALIDRIVLRRRLWPYPRPPWEHEGKRVVPAAVALASLLASPGLARWTSLLWAVR